MDDTVPLKPHYVYTLAYPACMGGHVFYVGKGIGDRINDHEVEARLKKAKKGSNPHKLNTIRKIWREGEQIAKTILAYFETHEEAIQYEIALIFFLPNLTNVSGGGDGFVGYVVTEEHRRKNSEAKKGQKHTEETRRKLSEIRKELARKKREDRLRTNQSKAIEESWKKNTKANEKRRNQLIELNKSRTGKPLSEEVRQKMSQAHKGREFSEKHRRKLSEANKRRWTKQKQQKEEED